MTPPDAPHSESPNDAFSSSSEESKDTSSRSDSYRRMRDDFDRLDMEKQATFLVDATVSLLARGIESAGRAIASEIDKASKKRSKPDAAGDAGDAPGPAGSGAPSSRSATTGEGQDPLSTPDAPAPDDGPPRDASRGPSAGPEEGPGSY